MIKKLRTLWLGKKLSGSYKEKEVYALSRCGNNTRRQLVSVCVRRQAINVNQFNFWYPFNSMVAASCYILCIIVSLVYSFEDDQKQDSLVHENFNIMKKLYV